MWIEAPELYWEDCQVTMARLAAAERQIDLAVTSPPYMVEQPYEAGMEWIEYQDLLWNTYVGLDTILKPGGYFVINFGDQCRGKQLLGTQVPSTIPMSVTHWDCGRGVGWELQATRVWRKKRRGMGIPFVCNHYPRPVYDYEHIWTWRKCAETHHEVVRNRAMSQWGVLEFEGDLPKKRHVAAFPLGLPEWAIQVYSDIGNLVYDPFMGSGTTGFAALTLERRFIGSEIDESLREQVENFLA
ncbi:MAG TPA: site-specific DNA-methyltransferase [Anaerolineae bacterium]|nr:site-specific DNA-methyltransferase [Anaerolineae bacterium]